MRKAFWLVVLPLLAGCGGGGGFAALGLGSLFGGGSISSFFGGSGGSLALLSSGGSIPTLTNPEPTSMLLLGSGLVAMAFYRGKKKS